MVTGDYTAITFKCVHGRLIALSSYFLYAFHLCIWEVADCRCYSGNTVATVRQKLVLKTRGTGWKRRRRDGCKLWLSIQKVAGKVASKESIREAVSLQGGQIVPQPLTGLSS